MRKLDIEEIKKIELDILDFIDKVCRDNGLKYYLAAGTLIGAVRHKGFIPWDDDIDIFMKREDYMKFIEICGADKDERYRCLSLYGGDKTYYYSFVKVVDTRTVLKEKKVKQIDGMGVWVDIFPLDYYDEKLKQLSKSRLLKYKYVASVEDGYYHGSSFLKRFFKPFFRAIYKNKNPRKYSEKIERIAVSCARKTDKLFICMSMFEKKDVFQAEWFDNTVELEFEGKFYEAPACYHQILSHRYGDYMKLPPEEERIAHHGIDVWYKGEKQQ